MRKGCVSGLKRAVKEIVNSQNRAWGKPRLCAFLLLGQVVQEIEGF
jgi:hypothetical protein